MKLSINKKFVIRYNVYDYPLYLIHYKSKKRFEFHPCIRFSRKFATRNEANKLMKVFKLSDVCSVINLKDEEINCQANIISCVLDS